MVYDEKAANRVAGILRMSKVTVDAIVRTYLGEVGAIGQPVHKGGGYYLMPDGSTVRGRKAAGLE